MSAVIRIGTRDSTLAVWQANQVKDHLSQSGFAAELVYIKSEGDLDLITPLYAMGVQGIFTHTLDAALLNGRIDLAVHSMKDVPVQLPAGIIQAAVLRRGPVHDLLLFKHHPQQLTDDQSEWHIATSSLRRRAQWLHRFPRHQMHDLRGNIQTRLHKFAHEPWDGVIFAQAGLERLGLVPESAIILDWMIPAPAQGAIMVTCRVQDLRLVEACHSMHDADTALCTSIEREFLSLLMGGCSTPIGALARVDSDMIHFEGNLLTPGGEKKVDIRHTVPRQKATTLALTAANKLKAKGGEELLEQIK